MLKVPVCAECGPSAVHHRFEYLTSVLDGLFGGVRPLDNAFWRMGGVRAARFVGRICLFLVHALHFLRLGHFTHEPGPDDSHRTEVLWEEAKKRGIDMREFFLFGFRGNIFIATHGGISIIFEGMPRPLDQESRGLSWMDNKDEMREMFLEAGIPVARGGVVGRWKEAKKLFESLRAPVITKPRIGSRSRHTTIEISDEETLRKGFESAKVLCPKVIMEEQLSGEVHRGTVIGGKLVAAMVRKRPSVIGNGVDTIGALIAKENTHPKRKGPIFHEIPLDAYTHAQLASQGYTLESIPKEGEKVFVQQKVGRGQGAVNVDATNIVHPDNRELLERAASVVDDPIIGFDFIIEDISRSWKEQDRMGIIECNSVPFIDLHYYPFEGEVQPVARAVWDIVFPASAYRD